MRGFYHRLHQIGGLDSNSGCTIDDDIGLQLLGLDHFLIGGEEPLDDRRQRTDDFQQRTVVGLSAQLVENVFQRGLGLGHRGNDGSVAGSAEPPDRRTQRVHLGVGLKQQPFDLASIVEFGERRRGQFGIERLGPFGRNRLALVDLRQQGGLCFRKILDAGHVTIHRRLDLLQPSLGLRLGGGLQRDVEFLRYRGLVSLQFGEGLFDVGRRPRQSHVAGGELNLAQFEMRGERDIGHLLGAGGALIGVRHGSFRHHLVGRHPDRQQDADRAGQTKFVPNAIELDHIRAPHFPGKRPFATASEAGDQRANSEDIGHETRSG